MKTKILLSFAALLAAACGSSSDQGWKTDELRFVPLYVDMYGIGQPNGMTYVDTATGTGTGFFCLDEASLFYEDRAIFTTASGYHYLKSDMKTVYPEGDEGYRDATVYHDGMAWVAKPGGPLTVIDKKGNVLFEFKQAETAYAFHEGLAPFANSEGLWGVVDKKGNVVVEPKIDEIGPMFVNGMIPVKNAVSGTWGIMYKDGSFLTNCIFNGVAAAGSDENFQYNYVQAFREGRIPVKNGNNKWGILNIRGEWTITPQFDEILLDGQNYLFRKGSLYGWCDKDGRYLINPQFRNALPFAGRELAAVQNKERDWGYIDREGKWAIEPQFRNAKGFIAAGIAPVQDEGSREWGAIDREGRWAINPQFRELYDYGAADKLLVLDQSRNFGIIDATGKYIVAPEFPEAQRELILNPTGLGARYSAKSDYVDVETYARLIEEEILSLKKTTAGELKTARGLKDANFPKNGGTVTIYKKKKAAVDMSFKLTASGVAAWNKVSDGWFGYNYTFRADATVDNYTLTVEFDSKGKARRFIGEIFDALTQKYPLDLTARTFTLPGYSPISMTAGSNNNVILQIKPE